MTPAHRSIQTVPVAHDPSSPAIAPGVPTRRGLYDPAQEKDSCGVGFIADLKGRKSHQIIVDALEMLHRMDHRGACGCEANTGDGAGIMTALPHDMLRAVAKRDMGVDLPAPGRFAAGNVFLPTDASDRAACVARVERIIAEQGLALLGWRDLPTDPDGADVGGVARSTMPVMKQLFIGAADPAGNGAAGADHDAEAFERAVYLVRKRATNEVRSDDLEQAGWFYICSLSTKVIVYKGQLLSWQVPLYYPDLREDGYVSHLAMVHSRFSTNTFPSWDRAQPCRFMSHNGEINTLRGNINQSVARQGLMRSAVFGDDLARLFPVVEPEVSDSGTFDNVLELLLMAGRSLPEAVMMMIPEAWENHESMPVAKRAFYEFHANLLEPWDGPASISFTDGKYIGAVLDRNGLRPSRWYQTHDDRVIMASEVGVVDLEPEQVKAKGRLEPGRMFLVDFDKGRIVADEEIKAEICAARPYGRWVQDQRIDVAELPTQAPEPRHDEAELIRKLQAFGYTTETLSMLLAPMVLQSKEAMGSMGNDAALAVLSDKPRLIYDYFKQLFAQVTNPPIDPIREEIIMSLETYIGPEGNLLETVENQAHRLHLPQPVLSVEDMAAIKAMDHRGWRSRTIDITYDKPAAATGNGQAAESNRQAMLDAIGRVCDEAMRAIDDGVQVIVLSDRAASRDRVALPALVATGAVHHHLVRHQSRTKIGVVVETGEAREVHHFCLLSGYGADAYCPYLAYEALYRLREDGVLPAEMDDSTIVEHYIKALGKGILKVMSKMGISTLASYKGAQIFEAVGLRDEVIDRCFAGTASRIQGAGFAVLAEESRRRHELGFPRREGVRGKQLPNPGEYHWRPEGEHHSINPKTIASLQVAARTQSRSAYEQFAQLCNHDARNRCTLRGLLRIKGVDAARTDDLGQTPDHAIDLSEVEPAADIVKRFRTGAMSLGALSKEAHETLALAMNRIGGQSNSGEGGEDPNRFALGQYGDGTPKSRRSAIKQIASGRFGVTSHYVTNADVLQIKIAQGAKPGEGGQLPAHKVDEYIAKIRHSTPRVGLISPPPHHDIYSIEDLAQLIFDLKNANPTADVSVKLVSEVGVGTVAAGVAKAHADHILVSGHDGGTGASPLTSIKHAGLPWELGIAETHQTLRLNGLRSRVRLETDGGMKTGRDIFVAACLGAEEYGFSTAPLIAVGCIMMRKCHLNTCPVGICTQDPTLRKKFSGEPEHVINYLFLVAEEARRYMAAAGIRTWNELVGRVDLLEAHDAIRHWKSDGLDLTPILRPSEVGFGIDPHADEGGVRKLIAQDHGIDAVLDRSLIAAGQGALDGGEAVTLDKPIRNTDRAVGAMLSYEVSKRYGEEGLPDDAITVNLTGSAGQSLGAFLAKGITIDLTGDANDYVAKMLSGGKVIVKPPRASTFAPEDNVVAGNVIGYGATGGELYLRGVVAERFLVRNSGCRAVVEGIGDHGCEYMTGGRAVILGKTGRNFAAGMSGGIAYVWDQDGDFLQHCNLGMVDLEKLEEPEDVAEVKAMVQNHLRYTGSTVAARVLADWDKLVPQFVKVMPIDYRKVLQAQKRADLAKREDAPGVGQG